MVGALLAGALMARLLIPWCMRLGVAKAVRGSSIQPHHTHTQPVSRLGGLALALPFAVTVLCVYAFDLNTALPARERPAAVLGALAMFALGFWDDLRPLGARLKLLWQIIVAVAVWWGGIRIEVLSQPWGGGALDLGSWSVVLTVLWLVAFTNLINLIDGLDGLAGGLSLMLLAVLTVHLSRGGTAAFLCLVLLGSLFVFLCYNFPPARIYLGDGGAYFLGFTLGVFSIVSSHKGTILAALVAPLIVLLLPVIDVSLAILRRGLKGLPLFRPDKGHIHHRLLAMGLSRRRAVLGLYAFTLVFLVLAVVALWGEGRTLPMVFGFATLCLLLVAGRLDFTREWFAVGRVLGNSMGMRQEVTFALAVTRWLNLEAQRVHTLDEFWHLLCIGARRLGFCSLTLELPDGRRHSGEPSGSERIHWQKFDFTAQGAGVLELGALIGDAPDAGARGEAEVPSSSSAVCCVADRRLFVLLSELFAEAWLAASAQLQEGSVPLAFAARLSRPRKPGGTLPRWLGRITGQPPRSGDKP